MLLKTPWFKTTIRNGVAMNSYMKAVPILDSSMLKLNFQHTFSLEDTCLFMFDLIDEILSNSMSRKNSSSKLNNHIVSSRNLIVYTLSQICYIMSDFDYKKDKESYLWMILSLERLSKLFKFDETLSDNNEGTFKVRKNLKDALNFFQNSVRVGSLTDIPRSIDMCLNCFTAYIDLSWDMSYQFFHDTSEKSVAHIKPLLEGGMKNTVDQLLSEYKELKQLVVNGPLVFYFDNILSPIENAFVDMIKDVATCEPRMIELKFKYVPDTDYLLGKVDRSQLN